MSTNDITQELLNELFSYDDGKLYWKVDRFTNKTKCKEAGYRRPDGYLTIRIFGKLYRASRVIYIMHNGLFDGEIDHIDGNPKNDRIENLRVATSSQNKRNTKTRKDNSSGVKGVSWSCVFSKWNAKLNVNGRTVYSRYFHLKEDAIKAIEIARQLFHGEFAQNGKR